MIGDCAGDVHAPCQQVVHTHGCPRSIMSCYSGCTPCGLEGCWAGLAPCPNWRDTRRGWGLSRRPVYMQAASGPPDCRRCPGFSAICLDTITLGLRAQARSAPASVQFHAINRLDCTAHKDRYSSLNSLVRLQHAVQSCIVEPDTKWKRIWYMPGQILGRFHQGMHQSCQ